MIRSIFVICVFAAALVGCVAPGATELPDEVAESDSDASGVGEIGASPAGEVEPGAPRPGEIGFIGVPEPRKHKGVRGGLIRCILPGTQEQVVSMLLDFENAAGHRAWAGSFDLQSKTDDLVTVRWNFEGKAGINPSCVLSLKKTTSPERTSINYKLIEDDFGLAAFFGYYRVRTLPGTPTRVELSQRVHIDSGVFFANASQQEIFDGLTEDSKLLLKWMKQRLP